MTATPPELILTALVARLGGEVRLTAEELMAAEELELLRMDDPMSLTVAVGLKVRKPPVIIKGELANGQEEIEP